jgi:uncharacterized protein YqeY
MNSPSPEDVTPVDRWRAELAVALRAAMKGRDTVAVAVLRSLSARIANAEAVPVDALPRAGAVEATALGVGAADAERRVLTQADLEALLEAEVAELDASAETLEAAGRQVHADELRTRSRVIHETFRPSGRGRPHAL